MRLPVLLQQFVLEQPRRQGYTAGRSCRAVGKEYANEHRQKGNDSAIKV
jgi:hypothetical protein